MQDIHWHICNICEGVQNTTVTEFSSSREEEYPKGEVVGEL